MPTNSPEIGKPRFRLDQISAQIRGLSGYRLKDDQGAEVQPLNEFLDMLATRGFSQRTLRTYGYCLLNFWRWFTQQGFELEGITEVELLDYIRFQNLQTQPAARSVNLRLKVVRAFYRFTTGEELRHGRGKTSRPSFPGRARTWGMLGHQGSSRERPAKLSIKVPRGVVIPLKPEEVRDFFGSFGTWRDLSIVGLMVLCGLRSQEVISLRLEDLRLGEEEIRVRGKGGKNRVLPLAPQLAAPLGSYLESERPRSAASEVFLLLKGSRRGEPMTPAGLRSLFRYHRKRSEVPRANPHRFRHTFAADMVRAGMSLPALMRLMGHSTIEQTMVYVEVSPEDVRAEFHRATERLRSYTIKLEGEEHG